MDEKKLLEALGKIDEELIVEAAPGNVYEKKSSKKIWVKWGSLAACVVLIAGVSVSVMLTSARNVEKQAKEQQHRTTEYVNKEEIGDYETKIGNDTTLQKELSEKEISEETPSLSTKTVVEFELTDKGFPDWGLSLSAKNVTTSGLTLVCTQSGGDLSGELETGSDYKLIVLQNGTWNDVPVLLEEYGWNTIAYLIEKENSTEFELNWEWLYGKLSAGTYRLVKSFMDFRGTGDYDSAVYWMEFEIQE